MRRFYYQQSREEFHGMLEAARKAREQDRLDRELHEHEEAGRQLCEQREREHREVAEYAI